MLVFVDVILSEKRLCVFRISRKISCEKPTTDFFTPVKKHGCREQIRCTSWTDSFGREPFVKGTYSVASFGGEDASLFKCIQNDPFVVFPPEEEPFAMHDVAVLADEHEVKQAV